MEQKKILFVILLAAVVICSVSCGAAEITKENDDIDFEEYFAHYDEMLGNDMLSTSYTRYAVREMEYQIDGFWDYYERYEKALQDQAQTIEEWETDFIEEGTYMKSSVSEDGIKDPDGNMSGYTVYEGELSGITFTKKDKGVIVSVIRSILIPAQE